MAYEDEFIKKLREKLKDKKLDLDIRDDIVPPKLNRSKLDNLKEKAFYEKHQQDVENMKEDRKLKKQYASRLYYLLIGEINLIFVVVFIEGFKFLDFKINEWLLGAIFNSIILQSFFLVRLVTESLFPKGNQ